MSSIDLGSGAVVIKAGTALAVSVVNPENILIEEFASFINTTGYASEYPNFSKLNIGAVHPFAVLLFQEVQNQKYDLDVFPSITVADNTFSEDSDVLSDAQRNVIITEEHIPGIQLEKADGSLFISDAAMAALVSATANGGEVPGTLKELSSRHSIGISIWSQNRDITNLLFDLCRGCLMERKTAIKGRELDIFEIGGSRTGDVNFDFGTFLYGASLTVPVVSRQTTVRLDADIGVIDDIRVVTEYSVGS